MTTQQQEGQQDIPPQRNQRIKHVPWIRLGVAFVAFIIVFVIGYLFVIGLLNIQASIILAFISIIIGLFQWLFPISSGRHEQPVIQTNPAQTPQVLSAVQPIIVQVPTTQPLVMQTLSPDKPSHRGIMGLPPPTDPRTIQQREHVVKEVYAKLTQSGITAITLTGIGGAGKSTLAALIYHYAEEQRHTHTSPFLAEALWFAIDPTVTFADLAGNLFEALGKPLPDMSILAPQNQAVALFKALNSTDNPRLIILDQFENLLDWNTGRALTDRPGVGEWLNIINSQQCTCRILLTSRPRPVGTDEYPLTYLQEYPVGGLELQEGIALLQSQRVQGTEIELQTAVKKCVGHALSLTLLSSLLRDHNMNLATLFINVELWTGNIAINLLDQIYTQRLTEVQRVLLLAFSVYREPILLDAAQAIVSQVSKKELVAALNALRVQHLLEPVGEGHYQLHAIIADYVQGRFDENNKQASIETLKVAHAVAAQYYLKQAKITCPPRGQRRKVSDVHDLIEAVWQWCQAEKWQEAFNLMEQEEVFTDLNRWGGNAILLEICQLLLPSDKWHPEPSQGAHIYNNLGWVYSGLGQNEIALDYFEQALEICKESGDQKEEGPTLNNLGWIYSELGQMELARGYLEKALNISRTVGDRKEESRVLSNLSWVYNELGQMELAQQSSEQALALYSELGDRKGKGWALHHLGKVYSRMGRNEQAREYLEQALSIRREAGHRLGEGRTLNNLGRVYSLLEQNEQALRYCEEALSISQEIGDRYGEGLALNNLGSIYTALGKGEQAKDCCEQALSILKEVKDRGAEGRVLNNLGEVCNMLGQKEEALQYYRQALKIRREVRDRLEEGEILHSIGKLYFEKKRYKLALACFLLAKNILEEIRHPNLEEMQSWIEKIHQELGDEQFTALLATVEPQAQQIVDHALREELE